MKVIIARATGYSESDWSLTGDNGQPMSGTARNVLVAEEDGNAKLRLTEEFFAKLSRDERAYLGALADQAFGSSVVASFRTDSKGRLNVTGLRIVAPDGQTVLVDKLDMAHVTGLVGATA